MKLLVVLLGIVGAVAGVAVTIAWHAQSRLIQARGWTLYSPLNSPKPSLFGHPSWWPTVVIVPLAGLGVGLALAATLILFGLRLGRNVASAGGAPDRVPVDFDSI